MYLKPISCGDCGLPATKNHLCLKSFTKLAAVGKECKDTNITCAMFYTSKLQKTIKEFKQKKYTITAIGIGHQNRYAVACNNGVWSSCAQISFNSKMESIETKNIKKISFGPNDGWTIVMKNGWCYAHCLSGNDGGPLDAIKKHNGNITYVSFGRATKQWIVGYGKNGYQSRGLTNIHKNISNELNNLNKNNKDIIDVEIGRNSYIITHGTGWKYNLDYKSHQFKFWLNSHSSLSGNVLALW